MPMDFFLVVFVASIFLILGCIGSILPILPGPVLSYVGLLIIHFFAFDMDFLTNYELIIYGFITLFVFLSDYVLQLFGVKKMGGKKKAVYGTTIGIILGMFFIPPFGIVLGAFLGAFLGALMDNQNNNQAFKIAFGSLIGFVFGTLIKLIYSFYMISLVITKLFVS
ncbi:MAG: hypothetical protein CMP56_04570 [Flavobacteriales bacterium]|nr:hypothetical protein [Flavobacteriales bacterium]|tara:strand:- start:1194 stop:1691 length:498 start_codon:yes stop_codon:yes gene_type:complete